MILLGATSVWIYPHSLYKENTGSASLKCHLVEMFWSQIDSFLRDIGLNIDTDRLLSMENAGEKQ